MNAMNNPSSYEYKNLPYPQNLITAIGIDEIFGRGEYIPLTKDQEKGLEFAISQLKAREQIVINERFIEHKSLKGVGEAIGVGQERARQIVSLCLRKLRHPLKMRYYKEGLSKIEEREARIDDAIKAASVGLDETERRNLLGDLADVSVAELRMSLRAANILRKHGGETIEKMLTLVYDRPKVFVRISNLGQKTAGEILKRIADTGAKVPEIYQEYDWIQRRWGNDTIYQWGGF